MIVLFSLDKSPLLFTVLCVMACSLSLFIFCLHVSRYLWMNGMDAWCLQKKQQTENSSRHKCAFTMFNRTANNNASAQISDSFSLAFSCMPFLRLDSDVFVPFVPLFYTIFSFLSSKFSTSKCQAWCSTNKLETIPIDNKTGI